MAALALNLAQTGGNLLMGLLAAHDKRVAAAKAENSALNGALAAYFHDCNVIADGFTAGAITLEGGVQACLDVDTWYWQYMNPYSQYKNVSHSQCSPDQLGDAPGVDASGDRCWQSTKSGTHFTAASYVGCNVVDAGLGTLRAALLSLKGKAPGTTKVVKLCGWVADKYGLTAHDAFTVTLTVPNSVNPEEVTLSQSGILSVGQAPRNTDVVVERGTVTPEQSNPSGQANILSSFGVGTLSMPLLLLAGFAILLIAVMSRK